MVSTLTGFSPELESTLNLIKVEARPMIISSGVSPQASESAKERKIAVLGTTPSRGDAPIADPTWEIWTIGPGGKDAHRWNRLYESHTVWPESFGPYLNDLSNVKLPQQVHTVASLKNSLAKWARRFKKDEKWLAEQITGDCSANVVTDAEYYYEKYSMMWFSTSIAYAIADVIEDHEQRNEPRRRWMDEATETVREYFSAGTSCAEPLSDRIFALGPPPPVAKTTLGLYGIDLESDEEYISQFTGTRHFMDIARLCGIDIIMPKGCGLEKDLRPYPNRYETHFALVCEKKAAQLTDFSARAEQERASALMQVHRIEGALIKIPELVAAGHLMWKDPKAGEVAMSEGQQQLQAMMQNYQAIHNRSHEITGELNATRFWQRMYVWTGLDPGSQQ